MSNNLGEIINQGLLVLGIEPDNPPKPRSHAAHFCEINVYSEHSQHRRGGQHVNSFSINWRVRIDINGGDSAIFQNDEWRIE